MYRSILDLELEDKWSLKGKVDIVEWVRGRELERVECHLRYCG